jgi:hypothetical protein
LRSVESVLASEPFEPPTPAPNDDEIRIQAYGGCPRAPQQVFKATQLQQLVSWPTVGVLCPQPSARRLSHMRLDNDDLHRI